MEESSLFKIQNETRLAWKWVKLEDKWLFLKWGTCIQFNVGMLRGFYNMNP